MKFLAVGSLAVVFFALARAEQSPIQPAPAPAAPQSTSYRIGPGDVLSLTVWTGVENLQADIPVASDGTLFVPFGLNKLLGVEGLTMVQARELLLREMKLIYRDPKVQVVVRNFESRRVFLAGDVATVGSFALRGEERLLDFIVAHGGIRPTGNYNAVSVLRRDGSKLVVDVADILLNNRRDKDFLLQDGDIIFVPSTEASGLRYYVFGEVRNPGLVTVTSPLTLEDLVARTGGPTTAAQTRKMWIARKNVSGGADIREIDFERMLRAGETVALQDRDVVLVPKRGISKFSELMATLAPVIGVFRDTIFLAEILRQSR